MEGLRKLEELERVNEQLEERAQTSVAAAEAALLAVKEKGVADASPAPAVEGVAPADAGEGGDSAPTAASAPIDVTPPASVVLEPPKPATSKPKGATPPKATRSTSDAAVASTTPAAATSAPDFDIPGAARPETQIRLYRAKVKALEADVREKDALMRQREAESARRDEKLKVLAAEQAKHDRESRAMRSALDKYQTTVERLRAELEDKSRALEEATRDASSSSRERKRMEHDMRSREVRMQRAIEEIDKYKQMVDDMKSMEKDRRYVPREDYLRAVQERTKLEKQKNELLAVFKKQAKLVDVLKRQKVVSGRRATHACAIPHTRTHAHTHHRLIHAFLHRGCAASDPISHFPPLRTGLFLPLLSHTRACASLPPSLPPSLPLCLPVSLR